MAQLISIIRPLNVLLIAVSQLIIYHLYIIPYFTKHNISRVLQGADVYLFVLVTSLIAAGSYIINDIKDYTSDVVNKPAKIYIGKNKLSTRSALTFYWLLTGLGGVLAIYIALHIRKPYLFVIYPTAVALLYYYSQVWKRRPLSGNIVVAIFCAFVPGIIWYAESEGMALLWQVDQPIVSLMLGYIVFGFLATMLREIVKDIEDIDGDQIAGYHTLPIVAGIEAAKRTAIASSILLLGTYGLWLYMAASKSCWLALVIIIFMMVGPTIYILRKLYLADKKADYSQLSKLLKYLIALSLGIFITILLII